MLYLFCLCIRLSSTDQNAFNSKTENQKEVKEKPHEPINITRLSGTFKQLHSPVYAVEQNT